MSTSAVARGFADPVHDSQKVFRCALDVMAHPGRIAQLGARIEPPPPLFATSASLLLALADYETSVWLDDTLAEVPAIAEFIRFHTGTRLTRSRREAEFAVIAESAYMPPLTAFASGTPEYPDRSTTLIIQVETLANRGWQFTGPGIRECATFNAVPVPHDFPQQLAANRARFPLGVDLIFATRTEIAALPRTCRIVEAA
jgi:alpha-D-ribose 1-methylphosphonate 5-triphosphate synthase subunit PhnH